MCTLFRVLCGFAEAVETGVEGTYCRRLRVPEGKATNEGGARPFPRAVTNEKGDSGGSRRADTRGSRGLLKGLPGLPANDVGDKCIGASYM